MEQFKGQPRLPKFAVPKRYSIQLKPDLIACKFAGSVAIDLDIVSDTRFIALNAAELSVDAASVSFTHSSKVFKPSKVEIFDEDGVLVLEFGETLPIGLGVLAIGFEGILNDKMKGFFRSTYEHNLNDKMKGFFRSTYEHNSEKKNMAVTQFEPVDARRCFPCWDEPAWKATFKIILDDVPSELVALSNMPIVEEKVDGHMKTVTYQESPIMSTYLVAIVVGLFDYIEDHTSDGVIVRVYCQVGKADQGKFALDLAVRTLEFYKDYFSVPYSLPKLDMVAIPDFYGAMENYGLVTYQESALLFDEQNSAAANKQMVSTVVTHELAHQWFGNLVTMEWWTHLWLNEGFATWVSYLVTDSLFPEWKVWTQFVDESAGGLKLDGLEESHPIEVEINHAAEVDEIFDSISYRKGASIIRMLQSYLGAECFQKSLASYIRKHASSNTITEDLWAALEEISGEPVNKLMNSWTQQMGYPVISVKVKDQKLQFDQESWMIRLPFLWLASSLLLHCLHCWVLTERNLTIQWSNLIAICYKLARIAADAVPELLNLIKQSFISLFQYSAEKLGWEPKPGESHLDSMLRGEILTALAVFGHDPTINEASRRFREFLDNRNTPVLPPDIRKAVYVAVMQRVSMSNRWGYESLLRVYREADLSEEKNRIIKSLASCPDPSMVLEVLNLLLSSEVRLQDAARGLSSVSSEGRETALTWLKDNWEHISKTWGSGFVIGSFVSAVVSPLASFEKVKEVDEFFKVHPTPSITRTLKQSIERVQINAKWVQSVQGETDLADVLNELAYRKD